MKKDKNIQRLIKKLKIDLADLNFVIVDHWDSDPYAIGIASVTNLRKLVYVSVFKESKDRYYYECEEPNGRKDTDYKTVSEGDKINYLKLLNIIRKHLTK